MKSELEKSKQLEKKIFNTLPIIGDEVTSLLWSDILNAQFSEALRHYPGFQPPSSGHPGETGKSPVSAQGQRLTFQTFQRVLIQKTLMCS